MKLFPKLALTVSTALIGTTLCLSAAFYLSERRSIEHEADQERRAILQNLVHLAQESFLTNDDLLLIKYTGWLQKWNPALLSASVVNPQGEVLAHSEPARIGKPQPEAPNRMHILVLSEPVYLGNHWIATASVEFSEIYFEELIHDRLLQLQKRVGQIAGTGLAAALIVCFLLALSWTRPIDRLAEAAGEIGRGKYDYDLSPTDHRKDELGLLARAFRQMADKLKELDQMKEDFVSAVTHELRSPLGAIESYLNLISHEINRGIDPASWQMYVERISVNTQRLTHFVNDLLDVAAIERGKIKLELQAASLPQIVNEVLALFHPKLRDKKLAAELRADSSLPAAWIDPEKIRQVITNLVANAIKFTPEQGRIEISLEAEPEAKSIRISVRDTGVGIALADQEKIFDKFEQVRSARQTVKGPKGTGLGLSICKALVELHGSRLQVESRPGEGSTFYFSVSMAQEAKLEEISNEPHVNPLYRR